MKKALKIILGLILVAVIGIFIAGYLMSEKAPEATPTAEADELAREMINSLNPIAWDTTRYLQWTFPGGHDYVWDREYDRVEVKWGEHRVVLNTVDQTGPAYKNGVEVTGEEADELRQKAWSFFCNDSFWVIAPLKAFDPGTSRAIVTTDEGETGLMVTYESGGVTPGDKYLWLLDENNRPKAYKMWVKIIPVGGMKSTWEGWKQLSTGAWIATTHDMGSMKMGMDNLKGTATLEELGLDYDPFG